MNLVKVIISLLIVLFLYLQFKLWVGDGGIPEVMHQQHEIDATVVKKKKLEERNRALSAEVHDLKQGLEAIEERARNELGMIRKHETFYQVIKPAAKKSPPIVSPSEK
ncbi:MAG: cell division protein FtsB [Gammaproteobacteria bacterium]|nr:cell division protein FtsB [Gammaproteobacteria bacterium]